MSRYLTPSKLGLLVLITIYADNAVPSSGLIPVLSFITSHTVSRPVADYDGYAARPSPQLAIKIAAFEEALKNLDSVVTGRTLHDLFLERLWTLNSLHALHDFFRDLKLVVAPAPGTAAPQGSSSSSDAGSKTNDKIVLARTSPLGIFVRRAALEFTRLQFDDTVKLWNRFLQFRRPSERQWRRRHSSAPTLSFDQNFAEFEEVVLPRSRLVAAVYPELGVADDDGGSGDDDDGTAAELSTEEMERLLEFQIEKLQSLLDVDKESGRRLT